MVLLLLLGTIASLCFSQGYSEKCRPVKGDYDNQSAQVIREKDDSQEDIQVAIFQDEWFIIQAPNKANAKVLTENGDRYIQTNAPTSAATMLDYSRMDDVDNHKPLDIKIYKQSDSIYIKVPKSDDSNWYYIIDQTNNNLLGKKDSLCFDKWISLSYDEAKTRIIRVSPDNHVVRFYKTKDIIEVEVQLDTVLADCDSTLYINGQNLPVSPKDSLVKEIITVRDEVIRETVINVITVKETGRLGIIWLIAAITAITLLGVALYLLLRNRKNDKAIQQKVFLPFKVNAPRNKKDCKKYELLKDFPKDFSKGQMFRIKKGESSELFFETKEYIIPSSWEKYERKESESYDIIKKLSELPENPNDGDIIGIVFIENSQNGTVFFRYGTPSQEERPAEIPGEEGSPAPMPPEDAKEDPKPHAQEPLETKSISELIELLPKEYADLKEAILNLYSTERENHEKEKKDLIDSFDKQKTEIQEKADNEAQEKIKKIEVEALATKERTEANALKKIEEKEAEASLKVKSAEEARDKAIDEKKHIAEVLKDQFSVTKEKLEKARDEAETKLSETEDVLRSTRKDLDNTTENLEDARKTITILNAAQKKFTDVLTYVPFAEEYAQKVMELIEVANRVRKSATNLLGIESVQDYYHIMKSLAKYSKATSDIDMTQFYTDIKMITKGQMVLKDITLADYNQSSDKEQLHNFVKIYFYDTYLMKFVDAIIVLNETCIGLNRLVKGLSSDDVKDFLTYREELQKCTDQLEIEVETTHLFDKVGKKIDLLVTLVDAGFSPGDILEIQNCYVYLKGSQRPDTKIYVKAQS